MRRRRKTRYTWLPINNGTTFDDPVYDRTNQLFVMEVPNTGNPVTAIVPCVADLPQGTLASVANEGIGEIVNNEYILKRIVGKCIVDYSIQAGAAAIPVDTLSNANVIVTAGFFVARADPTNQLFPIGALETSGDELYATNNAFNTRQPWIWRRTWILGTGAYTYSQFEDSGSSLAAGGNLRCAYPQSNVFYGSVADGPHIDAKTGRRIRLNERLWFGISANSQNPTGTGFANDAAAGIFVTLDCRYLGAIR